MGSETVLTHEHLPTTAAAAVADVAGDVCVCLLSGFMAAATISGESSYSERQADAHVSLQFEQQNITSTSCSECQNKVWCRHIIAAILYRIRHAQQVERV